MSPRGRRAFGTKRQFIQSEPTLGNGTTYFLWCGTGTCQWCGRCRPGPGIDNWASSVGVHPGPDYQAFIQEHGYEPTVTLWSEPDYTGTWVTLRAGTYANLGAYGMNDSASSLQFNTQLASAQTPGGSAATLGYIPTVTKLHKNANPDCFGGLPDDAITVVESAYNLGAMYGTDWNDSISAIDVLRGPSYNGHWANLFLDANFGATGMSFPVGHHTFPTWFDNQASSLQL